MTNKLGAGLHHSKAPRAHVDRLYAVIKVRGLLTHLMAQIGEYEMSPNTKAFWEKIPNKIRKHLYNAR